MDLILYNIAIEGSLKCTSLKWICTFIPETNYPITIELNTYNRIISVIIIIILINSRPFSHQEFFSNYLFCFYMAKKAIF